MPREALARQGVLESEFLFRLTQGYVKDGQDEMGMPNAHGYRDCVGYAARAAMFLVLGKVGWVQENLERAVAYERFTKGRVPEMDVFIEATAAKAASVQGDFRKANEYAQRAQATALTLNGTTAEMRDYLEYVIELSIQIANPQTGS